MFTLQYMHIYIYIHNIYTHAYTYLYSCVPANMSNMCAWLQMFCFFHIYTYIYICIYLNSCMSWHRGLALIGFCWTGWSNLEICDVSLVLRLPSNHPMKVSCKFSLQPTQWTMVNHVKHHGKHHSKPRFPLKMFPNISKVDLSAIPVSEKSKSTGLPCPAPWYPESYGVLRTPGESVGSVSMDTWSIYLGINV